MWGRERQRTHLSDCRLKVEIRSYAVFDIDHECAGKKLCNRVIMEVLTIEALQIEDRGSFVLELSKVSL